ncbi:SRPBCC family protein [Frankia sp. CNm7]|uniref:SRPBCC family protein n=1 Tax=Frankia nepalensis TaxID=1836974 RepID=A0A937RL30_9ACTN|nr:SRPBCC family protein [Frankia nepalensis]MBL7500530.1 SRPBCC family protein [Frankia nepalensis]MBL7509776.1 SRPBCC family protein [Frankia nepalensis]MBL7522162.1 SRPBCC family protein [Frankia nepalensis]MBL7627896.1 SRPBCC family protein [Frankia nepalensis]
MASTVTASIDVAVPVRTAYDQWTQFGSLPRFMKGVESVEQLDDTHLRWRITAGVQRREFDAVITEQLPDERVAWRSTEGPTHAGAVTFHRLDADETRVTIQLDWQPAGVAEKVGSAIGADEWRVKADLKRFKAFIENR